MSSKKKRKAPKERAPRMCTLRQERFVDELMLDPKLNATQAAIRAGYKRETAYSQASRLLKNVEVQRLLAEKQAARAERVELTADEVLRQLKWQIGFNPKRLYDAETGRAIPPHLLPDDVAVGLTGMDSEELTIPDGIGGQVPIGEVKKFKFGEKSKSIELAMRHLGMFAADNKREIKHKGALSFEAAVLASIKTPPPPKPPEAGDASAE